jgi:hypothetical protein
LHFFRRPLPCSQSPSILQIMPLSRGLSANILP